jgi:hypothetical protein
MQGDTIFLLVFIFIVLIAVGIIGVLYFMHVSKYDESNTFYKNLLEIIKDNPSLSNDLEDKLLDKNFSIDDVSTSQRDLSNICGANIDILRILMLLLTQIRGFQIYIIILHMQLHLAVI